MDNKASSPIKAWVRRHSPLKSRNKPLPLAPPSAQPSPSRKPSRAVSGYNNNNNNASHSNVVLTKSVKPKRKLSGTLKQAVSVDHFALQEHDGNIRSTSAAEIHNPYDIYVKDTISPPNIHKLSERVSSLESQLNEARQELKVFRGVRPSRRRSRSHEIIQGVRERPSQELTGRFDGLAENLLAQRDVSFGSYTSRHSADYAKAFAQYAAAEEARMRLVNREDLTDETRKKRELSKLREASWQQIQDHVSSQGRLQDGTRSGSKRAYSEGYASRPGDVPDSGRPVNRRKTHHEKELPKPPVDEDKTKGVPRLVRGPGAVPVKTLQECRSAAPSRAVTESSTSKHKRRSSIDLTKLQDSRGTKEQVVECEGKDGAEKDTNSTRSPQRRLVPSPSRLQPVSEEFEWDEDIF